MNETDDWFETANRAADWMDGALRAAGRQLEGLRVALDVDPDGELTEFEQMLRLKRGSRRG